MGFRSEGRGEQGANRGCAGAGNRPVRRKLRVVPSQRRSHRRRPFAIPGNIADPASVLVGLVMRDLPTLTVGCRRLDWLRGQLPPQ